MSSVGNTGIAGRPGLRIYKCRECEKLYIPEYGYMLDGNFTGYREIGIAEATALRLSGVASHTSSLPCKQCRGG
jgi:hypothetical protein